MIPPDCRHSRDTAELTRIAIAHQHLLHRQRQLRTILGHKLRIVELHALGNKRPRIQQLLDCRIDCRLEGKASALPT